MNTDANSTIHWDSKGGIVVVAAQRSLASALSRIESEAADWVVVVRTRTAGPEVFYYAFRSSELRQLAKGHPDRKGLPVERALDMHAWTPSGTTRGRRPSGPERGRQGPAAGRVVDFDATGRIVAIGEREDIVPRQSAEPHGPSSSKGAFLEEYEFAAMRRGNSDWGEPLDIGAPPPTAGAPGVGGGESGAQPRGPGPAAELDVTLSAETKGEIQLGATELVEFRMELASEASPLAVSQRATARPDLAVVVSLSIENDAIQILKHQEHTLDPPAPGQPRVGFFVVKAVRAGVSRLAVTFRQGGSELGVIGLAIEIVDGEARFTAARGTTAAAPSDPADDDALALLVEQRVDAGQVFYQYILCSEALGLPYRRLRSKPLLDRGGGLAASTLAYVERIYERVTQELKSWDDLKQLQREARALGVNLCQELFDPEVTAVLWPLRRRIKLIQVVSWEPFIPWELVRLRDPDSGDVDDRFLAEYGLVRTLSDDMPPRALRMARWSYLGATFPMGSFPSVGAELVYFTGTSPETLRGRGITPTPIGATRDAFYNVLAEGDFDVLHISCHAESPHQSIDRANLIIGDETPSGGAQQRLIEVDTITVEAEARLKLRRPLVFLNACETGRMGAVLTAWGGWPNVFLRAGAGAFVGSSWAVRDKPAAAFSTAFYNAMLDGKTLAEAASVARASSKALGDTSWLAFKVYGHPRAQRLAARVPV